MASSTSMSSSLDQDLTHRHTTDNPTSLESAGTMDEEEAEINYVSQNRVDDHDSESSKAQRSAELFFSISTLVFGLGLEAMQIKPIQRPIPAQQLQNGEFFFNLTNNELYNGQTVPDLQLILIAALLPLFIQLWMASKTGVFERHKVLCVYFSGVGITITLTNFVKLYAGYFRPIFLQGCDPDENYEKCTSGDDRQMRLSFPSGHASLSFCGLCIFSFYLEHRHGMSASRMLLLNKESGELMMAYKQNSRYMRIMSIMCYFPVVIAIFIAASRVHDNMHFPADVVGGSLLGGSVAALVHQTWYSNLPTIETFTHEMSY
ncbi:unnamed protein product [Cylindrotheca closterium]|uniref:Phosphatidic acid phosphatase type 2/haloperoxidase domain-containing protein n=1 Tax=Cylindrotheca closterium TaxID=2856 RepID=A0AAD2FFE7_9STRA|nr:unnamed protein product [Cylindrotheca closterium]